MLDDGFSLRWGELGIRCGCCRPKGVAVSHDNENSVHDHVPRPDEPTIPELEDDETIAPRPEEEIADVLRAKPDLEDHSRHPA